MIGFYARAVVVFLVIVGAAALLPTGQVKAQQMCYQNNQVTNANQVCTSIGYAQTQDCPNKYWTANSAGTVITPGSGAANVVSIYIMNYSNLYLDNWVVSSGIQSAYLASPLPIGVGTSQGGGFNFAQNTKLPASPSAVIQVAFDPTNLNASSLAFQFNALTTTNYNFNSNPLPSPELLLYTVNFAIGAIAQTPPPPSLASQIFNFTSQLAFAGMSGYAAWSATSESGGGKAASAITTTWKDMEGILSTLGGGQSGIYTPVYNAQVTLGSANLGNNANVSNGQQLYTVSETSNGSQMLVYDQVFSLVGLQTCPPAFALVVQSYPLYLNTFVANSCTAQGGCPANDGTPDGAIHYSGAEDYRSSVRGTL